LKQKTEQLMGTLIERIALCVERGKINLASPYPPDLSGEVGADELVREALATGVSPREILDSGLLAGMSAVGLRFRDGEIFVPDVLMAAKAMQTAMGRLKSYFASGEVKRKGTFIIGTVTGDLHDIGKNLVAMIVEGAGWEVIDLGINVGSEKFIEALEGNPYAVVGMSALLTTTMLSMEKSVAEIKRKNPPAIVIVGGAPVTGEFASSIGADGYADDPAGAVDFLEQHKLKNE
jgi:methanogenic corrinoid protein MtbC1